MPVMFPIALDLSGLPVLLTGDAWLLEKRLACLDEAQAGQVRVCCAQPSDALRLAAGERLAVRDAAETDVREVSLVLAAGLAREKAEALRLWARQYGRLINVEDVSDLCDFYFTANMRRGDLVIAVSTSGASPTLARKLRDRLAGCFGPEWAERVQALAALRLALRARGLSMAEIMAQTEAYLAEKGWLGGAHCARRKEDA